MGLETIIQKRIHELNPYVQLNPGDIGYISPSEIYIAVDKNGLPEPLRMPLGDFLSSQHIETAAIIASSINVTVTYETPFLDSSYFFNALQVYKIETIDGIGNVRTSIPYHDLITTVNGFSLVLEELPVEPVTIIYFASEPAIATSFSKDYIQIAALSNPTININGNSRTQIIGLNDIEKRGLSLLTNEITVSKQAEYIIIISFSSLNGNNGSLLVDIMNENQISYGFTRAFNHIGTYSNTSLQFIKTFSPNDKIRFYIENTIPTTGSFDLHNLSITMKEI